MNTWEQILVIILSATLAIFLLLGIMATVKIIQILNQIKRITTKAEELTDKAEAIGDFFRKASTANTVISTLSGIVHSVQSKAKNKSKRGK